MAGTNAGLSMTRQMNETTAGNPVVQSEWEVSILKPGVVRMCVGGLFVLFILFQVVTNGAEKTLIITELPSHILEPKSLSESKPISNSSESKSGFSESKSGFSEPRGITEPRSKSSEARIKGPLGMCEAVRAYGGRGRGIVVSVAAFEKLWYIEDMIRNLLILSENTTVILLHLNKNSPYSQNQLEKIRKISPRVWVNPKRVAVQSWHGSLFLSHVLNFDFALNKPNFNFSHAVLLSSNSRLVRKGFERYVLKHGSSLGYALDERFKFVDNKPLIFRNARANKNRWISRIFRQWHHIDEILGTNTDGGKVKVLLQQKHEGSFYPFPVIVALIHELKRAHKTNLISDFSEVYTFLEEFIFPTWADKHIPQCTVSTKNCQRSGHNLIEALFTTSSDRSKAKAFGPQHVKNYSTSSDDFFGLKAFPRERNLSEGTWKWALEESREKMRGALKVLHDLESKQLRQRCSF